MATTRSTPPGPTCLGGWAGTTRPRPPTSGRPPWRRQTPSGTSSGWVAELRAQRTGDVEEVTSSRLSDLLSSAVPWLGSRAPNRATDCRAMAASRLLLKASTHAQGGWTSISTRRAVGCPTRGCAWPEAARSALAGGCEWLALSPRPGAPPCRCGLPTCVPFRRQRRRPGNLQSRPGSGCVSVAITLALGVPSWRRLMYRCRAVIMSAAARCRSSRPRSR
jgi:hypothetical protein